MTVDDRAPRETPQRDPRDWLQSPRSARVPDLIARTIMQEIVRRDMQPGEMMPSEMVLQERFHVGRASLREALRILENHGVIRIKPGPGGGPMVDAITSNDYGRSTSIYLAAARATQRELLEARALIEPMMVRLAAERLTEFTAERIRETVQAGWAAIDEPAAVWSIHSQGFHETLAGASGNRVLDLFGSALICIHRDQVGLVFPSSARRATLKVHDRIATAVLAKDGATAERLTLRHIEELVSFVSEYRGGDLDAVIEWR